MILPRRLALGSAQAFALMEGKEQERYLLCKWGRYVYALKCIVSKQKGVLVTGQWGPGPIPPFEVIRIHAERKGERGELTGQWQSTNSTTEASMPACFKSHVGNATQSLLL